MSPRSRGSGTGSSLVLLLSVVCFLQNARGQSGPSISGCASTFYYREDKAIGTNLFNLMAQNNVTWSTNDVTKMQVNVTEDGEVVLVSQLDCDFEPNVKRLVFFATNSSGHSGTATCTIVVSDVNDNPPAFLNLPYDVQVIENSTVGEMLLEGISALDPDSTGIGAQEFLSAVFPDPFVKEFFHIETKIQGSGEVMNISLARPMDRETRSFYSFFLQARDGEGLNTTTEVKVTVIDVQDTPPFFLLDSYRAAIKENQEAGTRVIKVSAEDGDRDHRNSISYSLVNGSRTDLFAIDNSTGQITSLVALDRDNETVVGRESMFELTVLATENNDTWPQYGNSTQNVLVIILIEDINDNSPAFGSSQPYTAFVREDIPLNSIIYFDREGYIFVHDTDQGKNSHFNLTVESDGVPFPALEATPSEAFSEALVLLRVKDVDVFRNATETHILLQLVAREVSTEERYSCTAMIVITVEKEPEPPATAAPIDDKKITESDVVVFVIGFLVIFNIAVSTLIIFFMRRRGAEPRQGLVRKGSKYYVNGLEQKRETSGAAEQSGTAAQTYGEDTVMVEVEGKDRYDVVPLSAVLWKTGKAWGESGGVLASSSTVAGQGAHKGPSSQGVNFVDVLENGSSSRQTDRRALLTNEVAVARSSAVVSADVAASAASAASLSAAAPSFSMAKRNVTSPQNPAFSFNSLTAAHVPSKTTSAANYQLDLDNAAFPSTSVSPFTAAAKAFQASSSSTAPSATGSSAAVSPIAGTEVVTRFSSDGDVSTSVVAAPSAGAAARSATSGNQTGTGNDGQGNGQVKAQKTPGASAAVLY